MHGQFSGRVSAFTDFLADIGPLPLIPVRDVGELCFTLQRPQFTKFRHLPFLAAVITPKVRPAGFHPVFSTAMRALVKDLLEAFCALFIGRTDAALLLPGKVVVLERLNYPVVDFIH